MILNVGPGADGQIPLLQQERLLQLGEWLKVNGEAIYGSRSWIRTMEEKPITLNRIDPNIDFNWVRNGPGDPIKEDHFTANWNGFLQSNQSGKYTFQLKVDDEANLWIDGKQLTEKDEIQLEADKKYPIRIEYKEKDLNASIQLTWTKPDGTEEIIPGQHFSTTNDSDAQAGLLVQYQSDKTYRVFTQNNGNLYLISFEWPDDELRLKIDQPGKGMQVSLLGREGNLPWKYKKGELIVDLSGVKFSEVEGKYAWTFRIGE